jgi:hypothetical protein
MLPSVGIAVGEAGQERVLRGGPNQASHVVVGESVTSARVADLLDLSGQVVDVIHPGRVRILLEGQSVQGVVHIENGLTVAIHLAAQVARRVVAVGLGQVGWEQGLNAPARGIVGERTLNMLTKGSTPGELQKWHSQPSPCSCG